MGMVRDLDTLLANCLKSGEIIKDTKYSRLTAPGDNYGSVMLKLDVIIRNTETKEEKILSLVAKTLPETELFREIFKIQTTCTNEMAFYTTIVPTLQKFEAQIGAKVIDIFPKCYGIRKNLSGNSHFIDDDAVLLLENLRVQGYSNIDRKVGFDFETTKSLLRDVAQFHGSFLALKIKKPELFTRNVRPYCVDYVPKGDEFFRIYFRKVFNEMSKEDSECLKLASKVKFWGDVMRRLPEEPFSTVIHTDMWVNNTMQLFRNGKSTKNKFIDFQLFTYGSPAADVFFLLWTSVQKTVLESNLDLFLEFYHEELLSTLRNHDCDSSPFSYKRFLEEVKLEAEYEFSHAIHFVFILSILKDHNTVNDEVTITIKNAPAFFKEKVFFMVKECNKRGWLY